MTEPLLTHKQVDEILDVATRQAALKAKLLEAVNRDDREEIISLARQLVGLSRTQAEVQ